MRKILLSVGVLMVGATAALASFVTPSGADFLPGERFDGAVNGHTDEATIHVFEAGGSCHPSVTDFPNSIAVLAPDGDGYDGGFGSKGGQIRAKFFSDSAGTVFTFINYGQQHNLPATMSVPCSGSDTVEFKPVATGRSGPTSYELGVTYVNDAAS